jgi:hypothetical protein
MVISSLEQQNDSASSETDNLHLSANHDTADHSASVAPSDERVSQIYVDKANPTQEQQSLAAPEQQSDILRQIFSPSEVVLQHSGVSDTHFSESLASIVPDAFLFKQGLGDGIPHHANSATEQAAVMHQLAQLHAEIHTQLQTSPAEEIHFAASEIAVIGHEPISHSNPHDFHLG